MKSEKEKEERIDKLMYRLYKNVDLILAGVATESELNSDFNRIYAELKELGVDIKHTEILLPEEGLSDNEAII
jgi:predicted methyltransferase MtxX (methanogen marker protein 4)